MDTSPSGSRWSKQLTLYKVLQNLIKHNSLRFITYKFLNKLNGMFNLQNIILLQLVFLVTFFVVN